jgi:hypothetical protein
VGTSERGSRGAFVVESLLPDIAQQYRRLDVELTWNDAVIAHLAELGSSVSNKDGMERLTEEWVSSMVLPAIEEAASTSTVNVHLEVVDGEARARVD